MSGSSSSRNEWIDEFEVFCSSDDLSIDELQRMTKDISLDNLRNSSFLHRACMNEKVTLEIVEYLLELYPRTIHSCLDISYGCIDAPDDDVVEGYPLHLACYNEECPNDVIRLLLRKSPGHHQILSHICFIWSDWGNTDMNGENGGTPLHYYLSRTKNVDLDIVKQLSSKDILSLADGNMRYSHGYPHGTYNFGDTKCIPLHILLYNESIEDMFDVLQYLAEVNPSSLKAKTRYEHTPLHIACLNENTSTRTVKLLLSLCMDSVFQRDSINALPIHCFCEARNKEMNDEVATDILKLLLEAHPNSVSETADHEDDVDLELPIHKAAKSMPPGCCKVLLDAYPESVKRVDQYGCLPFHHACKNGRPDTVEYLFKLYPEAVHIRDINECLPIHYAVSSPNEKTPNIIKFLATHDPECVSKIISHNEGNGALPLHIVCNFWDKSNVTELLYDLYPEAILIRNRRGQLPIDIVRSRENEISMSNHDDEDNEEERLQEITLFFSTQMFYASLAQDGTAMRTHVNGLLPLHKATRDNAPLGAIKLLVKGYPDAINVPDGINGMLPFDIASEASTVGIVNYLVELSPDRLNTCDTNKNYLLHHACRGGNCKVIEYLLETSMSSAAVSERNVDGMLPIHLFCKFVNEQEEEEEEDDEEDTTEYTETIWRLLTAYPETVLNW